MEVDEKKGIRWYEVIYVIVLVAFLVCAWLFLKPQHRVGVLDINRVARELLVYDRMSKDDRATQEEAMKRMSQLQDRHTRRVNDLNKKLKAAGNETEKAKVQAELEALQETTQQSATAIRQDVQRHQALVVNTFRKRLQPFIEATARKRKMDIVFDLSTAMHYINMRNVDITDDVVARSRPHFTPNQPLIDVQLVAPRMEMTNAAAVNPPPARKP